MRLRNVDSSSFTFAQASCTDSSFSTNIILSDPKTVIKSHLAPVGIMKNSNPDIKPSFDQALTYLDLVVQNSPEKYQQFLTIMRGYQANPTTPANEVYDQVKLLFADKTSLIEGFKNFMPAKPLQESGEAYKSEEEVRMVTKVLEKSKL
ncbi:uncharacterized protein PAC_08014 [Phialocephala subalpina]|uniref:Uncharacterized protein n=1 Tax=Phialocephala subalpina TaxID=576137 RepID=A0A1L7WZC4_9HELO|nr:uncharacterized protein PAC_08014 [Phialocephala subalpina]